MSAPCEHLEGVTFEDFVATECPDCVASGSRWLHLRQCVDCGYVGCCDSSKNRPARAHFSELGHPVVRSIEPGETWGWCYEDETYIR